MFNGFKNLRYAKFIIDENGDKKPVDKGRAIVTYSLEEIIKFKDKGAAYAIRVPEGCVVVDCDTKEEGEVILNCIKDRRIKCLASKSTKGYHFYFRIPAEMKIKNSADNSIPLGLVDVDYRSGQSTSWIIEYRNENWSEWVIPPKEKDGVYALDPYEDLDELPFWLFPLKSNDHIITFRGFREGDGRNDKLNALRTKMVCAYNYTQSQIIELFNLINDYVFGDPLPRNELATVSTFRDIDRKQSNERWFDKSHFLHAELGEYLIKMMYCFRDTQRRVWYFNDKYYSPDTYVLEEKIVEIAPELTTRQRQEVINHISLTKIKSNVMPEEYHNWVCCNNVLVDGETCHTMGHTPAIFTKNMLEVDYVPDAYDENVDKFLDDILVKKGDKEQRLIFEEFLGYTLFCKENIMKKMLLCIGTNSYNGKSTMFAMVKSLLNSDNYSSVNIGLINEKNIHVIPQLVDKVANFDDEAPTSLDDSAVSFLKTIISNRNEITVNPKYKQPFQTFITAKMWVNSNHIIKTPQKGEEWMRRLLILSFNNVFLNENQDKNILRKLTTPSAKSYLLNLALQGWQRLLKRGEFTESQESKKWVKQYRIENDSAWSFLFTKNYSIEKFKDKSLLLKTVFTDYKNWCEESDIYPMGLNNFGKRLVEYFENKLTIGIDNNEWVIKIV